MSGIPVATRIAVMLAAAFHGHAVAQTQTYPVKPIRLIVPFVPGGSTDIVARLVAPRLGESLGQQVVVDNRGGAGGTIGTEMAARTPPDGYTIVLTSANTAMNVSLYQGKAIDPVKELSAISLLGTAPNIVAVHPSLPVRSIKQLISLAKARPGQINYASGGSGSTAHMATELFKTMAQVDLLHVPYKGTGPSLIATLSGESSIVIPPASAVLPHAKSGKLIALAICSTQRFDSIPELPTVAESGVPGYEASQWYGVNAPANTPQDIVNRLNRELVRIVQTPDLKSRLARDATMVIGSTPQEFNTYLRDEIAKWAKVVKFAGARVD